MTDKTVDAVNVTFVNAVMGRGILNGVVNLQLGTALFGTGEDGTSVDDQVYVSCRLRMDIMCAKQLYETLGDLLGKVEGAELEKKLANGVAADAKAIN